MRLLVVLVELTEMFVLEAIPATVLPHGSVVCVDVAVWTAQRHVRQDSVEGNVLLSSIWLGSHF